METFNDEIVNLHLRPAGESSTDIRDQSRSVSAVASAQTPGSTVLPRIPGRLLTILPQPFQQVFLCFDPAVDVAMIQ